MANDTISKLTNPDLASKNMINEEKSLMSKLSDYECSLANVERKHKLALNEITYKYKNEFHELEILCNQKCSMYKTIKIIYNILKFHYY